MTPEEIRYAQMRADEERQTMTVAELIEQLQKMPKKAKVYILADMDGDKNWDYDHDCWRDTLPLKVVEKETIYVEDFWDESKKITNVLLQVAVG